MLIKLLFPKYSTFLSKPGKSLPSLWRYTVRRYAPDSTSSFSSADETEGWHSERHTCSLIYPPHSPINIDLTKVIEREYLPFSLLNYDKETRTLVSNNGILVTIDFPDHNMQYTGGGVYDKFYVDHIHFHFGITSDSGSEHTINEKSFPMEMHIVHYNDKYPDIVKAKGNAMGISVFAFLFQCSAETNEALTPIIDMLPEVKRPYTSVPIDLPSLKSILPNIDSYYQYHDFKPTGHPTIIWTVFKTPIEIAETQLAEFRKLVSTEIDINTGKAKCLGHNYRMSLDLPNVRVFAHVPTDGEDPASPEKMQKRSLGGVFKSLFRKK